MCKAEKRHMRRKTFLKVQITFVGRAPIVAEADVVLEAAVEVESVVVGEDHLVATLSKILDRFVFVVLLK